MNPFPFEPTVRVGLCEDAPFGLEPHGPYDVDAAEQMLTYTPRTPQCAMGVRGLQIGRGFHWQQERAMRFPGLIQLRHVNGHTLLLNMVKAEEYLASVVGSEMNPLAGAEYIKAHAVISRSWLLRMLMAKKRKEPQASPLRWTQADAHEHYDVCPDDHCQRYQGLEAVTPASRAAVEATRGLVLVDSDGEVADARFSKCCGGRTELFSSCWDDVDYPYLQSVEDPYCSPERIAASGIDMGQYLKEYDRLTTDFYEWEARVPASLIREKVKCGYGRDLGEIIELKALRRGSSGRIVELQIAGTAGALSVGKELEIRRLLSDTHLRSSAFAVTGLDDGIFTLKGRGWGHGVGLCQIGAAVMAAEGRSFREILAHYYPGTSLTTIY